MRHEEKITWLKVLAVEWGLFLFFALLVGYLGVEFDTTAGVQVVAWIAGGFTVLYLLILSWRAAYLSGRGNR